ncbi:MAG: sugar-binding domain-containing protein, partial [Saprospiraceae bacterium]
MKILRILTALLVIIFIPGRDILLSQTIPLPEHPRPDFQRSQWINLNGTWDFEFDSTDTGMNKKWFNPASSFSKKIIVPFPWGSKLSGVKDEADIAWYRHSIRIPSGWKSRRVFLTIGASDWQTTVWLDGKEIGSHQGGYMPFSFDLTPMITIDKEQSLVIRVDDKRRAFTLYGKQGYGNARGLWQTVYLEARGTNYIQQVHCTPDIDKHKVNMAIRMESPL